MLKLGNNIACVSAGDPSFGRLSFFEKSLRFFGGGKRTTRSGTPWRAAGRL